MVRISEQGNAVTELFVGRPDTSVDPGATLASRFCGLLMAAETHFGERDRTYTFVGVDFASDGPYIWYPGAAKYVAIRLSLNGLKVPMAAYFEIAHEAIHLLSPSGGRSPNALEEGLAGYFARQYMSQLYGTEWPPSDFPRYAQAEGLVEDLLKIDPEAIKKLRERQPAMHKIGSDLILSLYPEVGEDTAQRLAARFEG